MRINYDAQIEVDCQFSAHAMKGIKQINQVGNDTILLLLNSDL